MSIVKALQIYLKTKGIKQSFIAGKCGWSKQKTSSIFCGKKVITAEELASICDALNVL